MKLWMKARKPIVAGGLTLVFIFASVATAIIGSHGVETRTSVERSSTRLTIIYSVFDIDPGDRLHIPAPWDINVAGPAPQYTSMYIVEGGEGDILHSGRDPPHVYLEAPAPLTMKDVYFVRPSLPETGSDTEGRLDVVWMYEKNGQTTTEFNQWADQITQDIEDSDGIFGFDDLHMTVLDGFARDFQYVLYAIITLGLVATSMLAVQTARSRPRHQIPPGATVTEELLRLRDAAGDYLASLVGTMRMTGALLIAGGLAGIIAVHEFSQGEAVTQPPFQGWYDLVSVMLLVLLLVAAGLWLQQYRIAKKNLNEWQDKESQMQMDDS